MRGARYCKALSNDLRVQILYRSAPLFFYFDYFDGKQLKQQGFEPKKTA